MSAGSGGGVFEAAVMGGALLMTLWGLVVVVADLVFGREAVPHSQTGTVAILVALAVVGGFLGAAAGKRGR